MLLNKRIKKLCFAKLLQVLHEEMIRSSKHAGREAGQWHIGVMVITGEQERTDEGAVQLSTAGKALSVHKPEDHSSDLQNAGQSHPGRSASINPSTQDGESENKLASRISQRLSSEFKEILSWSIRWKAIKRRH